MLERTPSLLPRIIFTKTTEREKGGSERERGRKKNVNNGGSPAAT